MYSETYVVTHTLETPTSSLDSGAFTSAQTVTLSGEAGATIYYTLDGSTPTTGSNVYSSAITIPEDAITTLKVFSARDGYGDSEIFSATYNISHILLAPTANPVAGTFGSSQNITLSAEDGSTIYYTVDGSTPSTSSTLYSSPINIPIDTTKTIKAIATRSGYGSSPVYSGTYVINHTLSTPTASVAAGSFTTSQTVTLSAEAGSTIYYTTNGSVPTIESSVYSSAITIPIDTTMTIKALSVKTNYGDSNIYSGTYTVTHTLSTPTASVAAGSYTSAQTVTLSAEAGSTIYYTTNGSTPTTGSSSYSSAITIPLDTSMTIKAFSIKSGYGDSDVYSGVYTVTHTLATPSASVATGSFSTPQTITLSAEASSSIYYTIDGSTPSTSSILYSGAITLNATTTLKAISVRSTYATSSVYSATYTINYILTYTAGANGTISGTSPQSVAYNGSGTAVTAVPSTGYHFVSWSDSVATATRTDTGATENKSVSASFAINTYTLTYTAGANGTISGTAVQTVNYGASGSAVTAVASTGYYFVAWSDAVATASRTDASVTSNITVSASFAIYTYTLTYTAGSNGTISGTAVQTVNYGASGSAVTAVASTGYSFSAWSDAVATASRTDTGIVANKSVTASFTINSYTLTFDSAGGSAVSAITQNYGTSITSPTSPTKTGYTFSAWSPTVPSTMPALSQTLTAQWSINSYTITFNSNGGSAVTAITQNYATAITAPASPTRTGYTFSAWSPVVPSTMPALSQTLTAQWTVNSYTLTFDSAGGSAVSAITQNYGTTITAPTVPTKTGYTFSAWSPALPATMPALSQTLTATWGANTYAVTWNNNTGGTSSGSATCTYGATVTPTCTPSTGYTTATCASFTCSTSNSFTPTFTPNTYAITWNSNTGGTSSGVATCTYNTTVTPTCTPSTGYTTATCASFTCSTSNSFTPTFTPNTYAVTWNNNTGGTSSGAATCTYNTTVTPTCTPSSGYSTATCASFTCSTSNSFTPTFSPNSYTITFNSNGGSAVTSITQNYGTAITAPASPTRTGYTFSSWSPAVPATMPVGGLSTTAQWSINSYTVTCSAGSGGSCSPTSASVTYGGTTSFTITPSSGYYISSVSGCGGSGTSTYTTGTITGACTVSASFAISYTSCNDILLRGGSSGNGVYRIDPDDLGGLNAVNVYCDMTTNNGGWTLVLLNSSYVTPPKPTWASVVSGNTVTGSFGTNLDGAFDQFLGVSYWNKIGNEMRVEVGTSSSSITKRTYFNSNLYTASNYALYMNNPVITAGGSYPGIYSYHAVSHYSLSTYDADHDVYVTNCATNYGNTAWWYGECWSGNLWGGGDGGGYYNGPFWDSSGSDYHNWGALWIRGPSNLVLYAPFEEATGTTTYDWSTNNASASTGFGSATASWTSGVMNNALNFTSAGQVSFTNPQTSLAGNLTVEYWMYPTNVASNRYNPVDKAYWNEFAFTQEQSGSLSYYHGWGSTSYINVDLLPAGTITPNNWYHIAMVRDTSARTIKGYLNGVLITTTPYSAGQDPIAGSYAITIGKGYTGVQYPGIVDEVKIYNSVRTAAQIIDNIKFARLTYTAGSNGTLSGSTSQTVYYNGSGSAVTAVPNSGYSFSSWSDGSTANPRTDTSVVNSKSVTASFSVNSYTVTCSAGSGGSCSPTSASVTYGGTTNFTVTPNSGYYLSSISGCDITAGFILGTYDTGAITGACTVSATFAPSAVATPTASPAAGTYNGTQSITLSTTTPGATIYYTTDYSVPANGVGCGTGGTVTEVDGYCVHKFTSSGTFTPTSSINVEVLVVAGGGAGRQSGGGGGGAGGLIYNNYYPVTAQPYPVTVGAGGRWVWPIAESGGNSVFGSLTAIGGGGGSTTQSYSGGSGAGGSANLSGGSATSGQGNVGGNGSTGIQGGGGGGAGGAGVNGTLTKGGNGGSGLLYYISGIATYYAGGGGGGTNSETVGYGGSGIGGNGGNSWGNECTWGASNTGSGGGGTGNARMPCNGSSGVVIIRYLKSTTQLYSSPISISSDTSIRAIAVKSGLTDSSVYTGTFTIITCNSSILGPDGITYGMVWGEDGRCWLNRNLGAAQVATAYNDSASYGYYYQWGRGVDGHQVYGSGTTTTLSSSDTPGHSNFIAISWVEPYDWRSPRNLSLWQGVSGTNNPCPTGFRLPTSGEWSTLLSAAGITNTSTAYSNTALRIPTAGYRRYDGAGYYSQGVYGRYWVSSTGGTPTRILPTYFSSSSATVSNFDIPAYGYPVRCIRN